MNSISVLIGRERARKLAAELAEAFAADQGEVMLTVDAKANEGGHYVDLNFTCERDWQDDDDILLEVL